MHRVTFLRYRRAVLALGACLGVSGAITVVSCAGALPVGAAAFGVAHFDGSVTQEPASGSLPGTAGDPETQAGAHPFDATTRINFDTDSNDQPIGNVKDVRVDLPAGFIGNPTAVPQCPEGALEATGASGLIECSPESQVGVVTVDTPDLLPLATFAVYNMVPPPGLPGEFGFNIGGGAVVHLLPRVRTGSGYGLSIEIANVSQQTRLSSTKLTLWGVPADPAHDALRAPVGTDVICLFGYPGEANTFCGGGGATVSLAPKPFLRNPTSCGTGPLTTSLSVDSWQQPGAFLEASFLTHDNSVPALAIEPTGCDRLPFNPSVAVQPHLAGAGEPSGYSVDLRVPQNENPTGLSEADLKKAVVTLPQGVRVSPSAASGLEGCSPEQIGLSSAGAATCPDASKIGNVQVETPLLKAPMEGSVYLAQQGNNPFESLLALYVVAEGNGVVIKLPGEVAADPSTGRLTATFDDNPQIPFSDLKLQFKDGPRAPLVNPPTCGTYETTAQLTSWSGETVQSTSSFQITQGQNGGACPTGGFAPSFTAGTVNPQAGGFSPFTVTFSRSDGDQTLGSIAVRPPAGLLGVLKSVAQCPEPQAAQGACGAGSLIGHTTVGAGPGSSPFYLGGQVFLTGPYKGAPFGLSIVVPALAGPFNLGTVVVRAAISVDPKTAALTITSDPLPTILQGIPLQIRTVNVTVDRAGFMFNPTDCAASSVGATISSAEGGNAGVSSRFQAVNCASLAFKPKLSASLAGKSSRANGAALDVKISSGSGQANIGRVAVSLPKALPSRLSTIQKACPQATFAASPASCPAGSLVGSGTAVTPILAHPLTGPAYLVSHGGAAFPDLVVVLKGEGITIDLTGAIDITKAGITSSTFNNVPDVPIGSFELRLPTGSHSALTADLPGSAKGSFCGQSLTMPTSITGQNGASIKQSTKLTVTGCTTAKKKTAVKSKKAEKATQATKGEQAKQLTRDKASAAGERVG